MNTDVEFVVSRASWGDDFDEVSTLLIKCALNCLIEFYVEVFFSTSQLLFVRHEYTPKCLFQTCRLSSPNESIIFAFSSPDVSQFSFSGSLG